MKRFLMMAFLICGMMTLTVSYAAAQEEDFTPEELEAIEFVSVAFSNIFEQSSFTSGGEMSMNVNISTGEGSDAVQIKMGINQTFSSQYVIHDDGSTSFDSSVEQMLAMQSPGQPKTNNGMTMDIRFVDEVLYIRVTETSGAFAGQYPETWVNINEDPYTLQSLLALINIDTYTKLLGNQMAGFSVTPESITDITELESDDETVREFEVIFNIPYLIESGIFQQAMGVFDLSSMGIGFEDMVEEMFSNIFLTMTIRIDAETHLIDNLAYDMLLDMDYSGEITQGLTFDILEEVSLSLAYSDYNQPITITAPEEQ